MSVLLSRESTCDDFRTSIPALGHATGRVKAGLVPVGPIYMAHHR